MTRCVVAGSGIVACKRKPFVEDERIAGEVIVRRLESVFARGAAEKRQRRERAEAVGHIARRAEEILCERAALLRIAGGDEIERDAA